jgi:protein-S-isoprenylcysteine O-methyltransferase Ste14
MNAADTKARSVALLLTTIFLILAPGTVAGFVPWWIGRWHVHAAFIGFTALRLVGCLLVAVGSAILIEAFLEFALRGIGTPAPMRPPKHLVVTGTYRYVRNPMYVAVVSLILGQGLIFGDARVLMYGLCVWLCMNVFVFAYEEPALRRSFSDEYAAFCANVPRWIPRLTPWHESN